jgi:hypothetical protein
MGLQRGFLTPVLEAATAYRPGSGPVQLRQWVVYWGDGSQGGKEILGAESREEALARVRPDFPPGTPLYAYELMPIQPAKPSAQ